MKFAVVIFPGSNCDHDTLHVLGDVLGQEAVPVWHAEERLPAGTDVVVLPGGFSYGDYLRCGAIARFAPVMKDVVRHARDGGFLLGICNGFQVLCEAGLLPGALLRNADLRFHCHDVHVRVEGTGNPFTAGLPAGAVLRIPIAHGEGNWFAPADVVAGMEAKGQILLRYSTPAGEVTAAANPNGSLGNVAGIASAEGNVVGLMPHPERLSEEILGGADGLPLFRSLVDHLPVRAGSRR